LTIDHLAVLLQAEMQMTKAENLVTYAKEIAARPPKSWFQTPKEKEKEAEGMAAARGEAASAAGRRAQVPTPRAYYCTSIIL
jgi:ATP-dependent RNA helicase DDX27